MNYIITIDRTNAALKKKFRSSIDLSTSKKNNITFTDNLISALSYAAINPTSSLWIDWKVLIIHFVDFYSELEKINKWIPIILIVNDDILLWDIFSKTNQIFALMDSKNFDKDFGDITKRLTAYNDLLSTVHKKFKNHIRPNGFFTFTGNSSSIYSVYNHILKIAETDFTVLITGESGSGKELVAKTIHKAGSRKKKKFQSINCAAIPDNLLESELFGFEKGAFTDASNSKPGKFELADGGTVFLDEIGDMSITLQAKLLRVLEDHIVERLGGTTEKEINIQLLAATNKNLKEKIADKTFREDLYYRLNVIPIRLPALSDRTCDIPLLTFSVIKQLEIKHNFSINSISWTLIKALQSLPLKGNVRELENIITRIIFQSPDMNITANLLDDVLHNTDVASIIEDDPVIFDEMINPLWKLEKMAIGHAMNKLNRNMTQVASQLEISRSALYRKMKKYNLNETEDE